MSDSFVYLEKHNSEKNMHRYYMRDSAPSAEGGRFLLLWRRRCLTEHYTTITKSLEQKPEVDSTR